MRARCWEVIFYVSFWRNATCISKFTPLCGSENHLLNFGRINLYFDISI
jgi:hypothetical protein